MGRKYSEWVARSNIYPKDYGSLVSIVQNNREFQAIDQLDYGDHGLEETMDIISKAIRGGKRIALYADYDVDGTMSAVSWIWFFRAIGFDNFLHYIPCRFKEGYGVNLEAVKHLIENERADLIITMDTGITANGEASYCKSRGVDFICTDHHKVQIDKMPDCTILNPKLHPDERYQELCGCGITFVLLRKLAEEFPIEGSVWTDILALTGMATICDVVPLNGVNHKLAKLGVQALMSSQRDVLVKLRNATAMSDKGDEKDVGFRVGPRINAVGRLEHADSIIEAFIGDNPDPLIKYMETCNDRRKQIQQKIVAEAEELAERYPDDPILFLGGDWHPGVVGIAASKIAEKYWKPTWLFNSSGEVCKGSARSMIGMDVTDAMSSCGELFLKFGGHKAAGGYSFSSANIEQIRIALNEYGNTIKTNSPDLWVSKASYDCLLPVDLIELDLADSLQDLKPFGHAFEEPVFMVEGKVDKVDFYKDKVTGAPRHSAVFIEKPNKQKQKIMFFNDVLDELENGTSAKFLVTASRNKFRGIYSLDLYGVDVEV